MRRINNKKGQVWVETVIYTLIGLAIMGLILAGAKGPIDRRRDTIVIEQSIESMGNINEKIYEVQRATGNRRAVDLKIGSGKVIFDMANSSIIWEIESSFEYSELDERIPYGTVDVLTEIGSPYKVSLIMSYPAINFKYEERTSGQHELFTSPMPYQILIENMGTGSGVCEGDDNKLCIEFREV